MRFWFTLALAGGLAFFLAPIHSAAPGQHGAAPGQAHGQDEHVMLKADEIDYEPGPASLPEGAEYAVLEGDPASEGPFTMRLKLPANYRIPPHTHPKIERVTVIEGSFRLGMGRTWQDEAMEELTAGSFFVMPVGMAHFAAAGADGTVVQLNGVGPWGINYINPQDDPRRQ